MDQRCRLFRRPHITDMEQLLFAGSAASAAIALITLLTLLCKSVRKLSRFFEEQANDTKQLRRHDKEQYLAILRLTIVSQEMPLTERIKAGDRYIEEGGNGAVRQLYEQLLTKQPYRREEEVCKPQSSPQGQ